LLNNGNLASCSSDKTIRIWGTTTNYFKCLHILKGHIEWVYALHESNKEVLFSGGLDRTIRF